MLASSCFPIIAAIAHGPDYRRLCCDNRTSDERLGIARGLKSAVGQRGGSVMICKGFSQQ